MWRYLLSKGETRSSRSKYNTLQPDQLKVPETRWKIGTNDDADDGVDDSSVRGRTSVLLHRPVLPFHGLWSRRGNTKTDRPGFGTNKKEENGDSLPRESGVTLLSRDLTLGPLTPLRPRRRGGKTQ